MDCVTTIYIRTSYSSMNEFAICDWINGRVRTHACVYLEWVCIAEHTCVVCMKCACVRKCQCVYVCMCIV